MKKLLFLLIPLLLTQTTGWTNPPAKKRGYAAIRFGVGIPSGNFAEKSFTSPSSGYAQPGPCFDLNVAYKVIKYVGFAAMLRTNYYFLAQKSLANDFVKANPGYSVKATYPLSFGGMYMAGLYFSVPLDANETISLDTRALGGLGYLFLPHMTVTGNNYQTGDSFDFDRNSAFTLSPAYLFGAGLRFNFGRFMAVLVNVDYTGAKFSVHNQETTYTSTSLSQGSYTSSDSYLMSYGCINATVGAAFRFGREK